MRTIIAAILVVTFQNVYADCVDVIRVSLTTAQVVQSRDAFESHAESFCKDYKSHQSSARSTNFGASYKFLAVSMGNASATEIDVASRFCSAESSQNRRSDAYRQYVESINDRAYGAYEACEKLGRADIEFGARSVLPTELMFSVGYTQRRMNSNPSISFYASEGVDCSWLAPFKSADRAAKFTASGTASLVCRRGTSSVESSVTLFEDSSGDGNALTLRWPMYNEKSVPVNLVETLRREVRAALEESDRTNKLLKSSIVAFHATICPTGWEEYEPARGRFIRGLDSTGAIDPQGRQRYPGSPQEDALRKHHHDFVGPGRTNGASTTGSGGWMDSRPVSTTQTGDDETRPKNVALLFCRKV